MEQSHTSFSVSGDDPFAQLLQQVKEAAEGVYDVLGEIGRSSSGNVVYLAREIENGHLLALKLIRQPSRGPGEFDLNVVRTLDATVPGLENRCPECSKVLPDWERFCFHCGADLSAASFTPSDDEASALLAAVREATVGQYDIVGKMDRSDGGGMVFFARDLARNKIVALRLKKDNGPDDEQVYSIGETQVLNPLAAELAATQMAPPAMREALRQQPLVAPPVSAPPPVAPAPAPPPVYETTGSTTRPNRRTMLVGAGALALVAIIATVVLTSDSESIDAPAPVAQTAPPPAPAPTPDTTIVAAVTPPPATPAPTLLSDSGTVVVADGALPQGARVTIDGRTVRRWPVRLVQGTHNVAVTAPGFDALRERVQVTANDTTRWRPTLVAQQVAAAPAQPAPATPAPAPRLTCARAAARSDWEQAASLCSAEAEAGGAEAQRIYGEMFASGRGVTANATQAATWFSKAATAGDREAQLQMGMIYRNGTGVKRDDKRAAEWFRQAADNGSVTGMMEYAVMLDGGRGVSRNDVEAANWFRKASDAGSAVATRRLGRLYERGEGVPKSENEAATLYRRAADKGDAEAQYQLGRYYKDGKGGLARSNSSAIEWFRKAAAQDHPAARDELRKLGG